MMASEPNEAPAPGASADRAAQQLPALRLVWRGIRTRLVEGLLVILPLLVTFWIIRWMYRGLETYVIDPLAVLVLWKSRQIKGAPQLPYWFETYAAPLISIFLALVILYCCGALAHSWLRRSIDKTLLRIPLVAPIYDSVRNVLQGLGGPGGKAAPQRIVLVSFPHPGMRLPAIVTSTCRDTATQKTLLCVYVPTTPVPSSGFFLIVPEESATDLNWSVQQTLQAIISGGLTAPPEISYYQDPSKSNSPPGASPFAAQAVPLDSSAKG
jgi:uncharacterized membrane protein